MQQLSENVVMVQPGDQPDQTWGSYLKIFLGGSIDFTSGPEGAKYDWQTKICNGLVSLSDPTKNTNQPLFHQKFMVINPKAPAGNPEPSMANPEFINKFNWELMMYDQADAIFVNFLKRSKAPSSMTSLLMNANTGKVIVRCPQEYVNYAKVNLVAMKYGIPLFGNASTIPEILNTMFQTNQKFIEVANYGLQG